LVLKIQRLSMKPKTISHANLVHVRKGTKDDCAKLQIYQHICEKKIIFKA